MRAGLSMRGLARRSGLSAAQISRIEAGEVERPAAETLVKLAKALDRDAQLLLVFAGYIGGARARRLLRAAVEALPEPGRAEQAHALARLEAEDERERRLGEELAEAERALAEAPQDLDEAVVSGPGRCVKGTSACARSLSLPKAALPRSLRSAGSMSSSMMLRARRSATSPAASSCTRLLAATTSRLGSSSRVRSRLTTRSCASCSRPGVSWSTGGARKSSNSPKISWLSRCYGLSRPSLDLSRPLKRPSSSSAACPPGRPRTDTRAAIRGRPRGRRRSRRAGGDAYGVSKAPPRLEGMKDPPGGASLSWRFRATWQLSCSSHNEP